MGCVIVPEAWLKALMNVGVPCQNTVAEFMRNDNFKGPIERVQIGMKQWLRSQNCSEVDYHGYRQACIGANQPVQPFVSII